ncbi:MCMP-loop domain-containing protein [Ordospora pajunii]|uniref:MCMP-loop domain-containing protein n=1 Tax=Ordospora pajunii TaxID=3039483 RepID=UPI00295283A2|nr:MCMP-loop domain-containing protein [Ordospora pajunii]KAH9410607.1 MCMP-loop domain-containing protein [Ordospora pajunii]
MHIQAWAVYFPEEELTAFNELVQIVADTKEKLKPMLSQQNIEDIAGSKVYELSIQTLEMLVPKEHLDSDAGSMLSCICCALSEILYDAGHLCIKVHARITTFRYQSRFVDVDGTSLGKLVFISGTVCRVGFRRIVCIKMEFECTKCGEVLTVSMKDNIFRPPRGCKAMCNSKVFVPLKATPGMHCMDTQDIKIQELYGGEGDAGNRMPRMMECILNDDFVGTMAPGDIVQVVGVLGVELESESLYKLVIRVNNIQIVKNKGLFVESLECQGADFMEFRRIAKSEGILNLFIEGFYSTVYGNELIKAGLVLALFGGTRKSIRQHLVRSEIHVLIIGDPGLGKSRLLLSTCVALPKSSYVSGSFATAAGLTVSLTHDPISGEYMADAGALVVTDNGVCCLDEFDKIDDHAVLFEAMEDQRVSVAKGGVICSIPTRSTVVAATNPRHGHFDRTKGMEENVRFDSGLLSRFDLVFVLLDDLAEDECQGISTRILRKRQGANVPEEHIDELVKSIRSDVFIEDLKRKGNDVYACDALRKYILYARGNVFPTLSKSAKDALKEYYLEIRKEFGAGTRDLEALVRLTEARAKMELRSIATKADAMFSVELYRRAKSYKKKMAVDRRKSKDFNEMLREYKHKSGDGLISREILCEMVSGFDCEKNAEEFIEMLNHNGALIRKGKDMYKILI